MSLAYRGPESGRTLPSALRFLLISTLLVTATWALPVLAQRLSGGVLTADQPVVRSPSASPAGMSGGKAQLYLRSQRRERR